MEIETYRLARHFIGDAEGYRPEGEKDALLAKDPMPLMRAKMLADAVAIEAELDAIESESEAIVDAAIQYTPGAARRDHRGFRLKRVTEESEMNQPNERNLTIARAMAEAVQQEMQANPTVFVMCEDIAALGGVYGDTRGLL